MNGMMGRTGRWWPVLGLVLGATLMASVAAAQPASEPTQESPQEGVVVRVDDGEVIVDLGRDVGLQGDAVVQVYRRVEVRHPRTGRVIEDRFPIGSMVLQDVGALLSIGNDWSDLRRTPRVGDFVVFEPLPPVAVATDEPTNEPVDPARQLLDEAFLKTLGQPLTERIAIWEIFIKDNPESPFLDQVGRELNWLRAELSRDRARVQSPKVPKEPGELRAKVSAPPWLYTDEVLEFNVAVIDREYVQDVRLLVRRLGQPSFRTVPMERVGDYNWRVVLGEQWMKEGILEFFTEIVRTNSQLQTIGGNSRNTRTVSIETPPQEAADSTGRSRATTLVEFVDFKSGRGDDQYLRFESSYRYQISPGFIHAFTTGVGVFSGEGGTVDGIAAGRTRQRSVNFGFAQLELQLHPYFSVSGRLMAGNHHQTDDGRARAVLGGRVVARIGEAEGTRLELGGALTEDVGNEAWTELTIDVIEDWPISAAVVVTNLPVGGDLGVSATVGLGYQVTDWLSLSARTGWNARTINHYGFTGGLGAELTW